MRTKRDLPETSYWNVSQYAAFYNIAPRAVYRMLKNGEIPGAIHFPSRVTGQERYGSWRIPIPEEARK